MRRGVVVVLVVGLLGTVGCGAGEPSLSVAESVAFSRDRAAIIAVSHRTPASVKQWRRRCTPLVAAPTAVQQEALARVMETVTTRGDHLLILDGDLPRPTVSEVVRATAGEIALCRAQARNVADGWVQIEGGLRAAAGPG